MFSSSRSGNWDVWSMDPAGSDLVNLTDDPFFDASPGTVWVPPGTPERIVFVSNRAGGNIDIYAMDVDGSNLVRVTTDPGDDFDASWAGDGARLAFDSDRKGNWDIYTIESAGTNTIRLTWDIADDESPAWRP
jgi:Tol biopolymer transport system component